jgi:hypothetical protein
MANVRFVVRHLEGTERCPYPTSCYAYLGGKISRWVDYDDFEQAGFIYYRDMRGYRDDTDKGNPYAISSGRDLANRMATWLICSRLEPGWPDEQD